MFKLSKLFHSFIIGKIHQLQEENDTLKTTLESNSELDQLTKETDQIILELESTRNKLEDSNKVNILISFFNYLSA